MSELNSKGPKAGKKLPVKPNVCARVKTTVPETLDPSMFSGMQTEGFVKVYTVVK